MINFTIGRNIYKPVLEPYEMPFSDFCDTVSSLHEGVKAKDKQSYFCITGDFKVLYRKNENLKDTVKHDVIVIDGDKDTSGNNLSVSEKDIHIFLKMEGLNHVVYSSYSKSTEKHRWRAVIQAEGVTSETLESTTRDIVSKIQKKNNVGYAVENHKVINAWYFGGMKYPKLHDPYKYIDGVALKSSEKKTYAKDKDIDSNTTKSGFTYAQILETLRTGSDGYHDAQINYSFQKIKDGVKPHSVKAELYGYLECWKGDSDRHKRCYDEVDRIVDGADKEKKDDEPYVKYNISARVECAWNERHDREKNGYGLETHIKSLNNIIRGFSKKQTITIGGSTGAGKTALALNFTSYISDKVPVLYLSLEMTEEQIFERLALQECGDIKNIPLEAYGIVAQKKLIVHDTKCNNIDLIEELCLRVKTNEGIECIFIDHIHKIRKHKNNTLDSLQDITERLSSLAKDLDVPIVMLSQCNRNTKDKDGVGKKIELSNLRGSGSIEEDSNIVLLINRPLMQKPTIVVAKNRNGPIGDVEVKFKKESAKFVDAKPLTKGELEEQLKTRKTRKSSKMPAFFGK